MNDGESLFSARYHRLVRRLCGSEFAMQERNWREVLKINAQYAEAHREALHHLDCVELVPSDDGTDWERVEAAKAALQGRGAFEFTLNLPSPVLEAQLADGERD